MAVELDVGQALLLGPGSRSGTGKAGTSAPGRLRRAYAGEGEAIVHTPERELRILCDHDLLNLTWTRHAVGERGAEPHIHKHHTDGFYVLQGEVTFVLGPELERMVAPAGTVVLIPPGVVHGFDNDGPAETQFLNIHAPGEGFVKNLRGHATTWDTHDPPADGGRPASDAVVRRPGEGHTLALGPNSLVFKAEVGDGDGTFYLGESTLAPGFPGPPPHRHDEHLDSFFVLEGTLTLQLGDDQIEASAGSYAVAPPGSVHTFSNPSEGTVRALNIMAPGGFEQYLKQAAAAGTTDPAELAKIASRYDFKPA